MSQNEAAAQHLLCIILTCKVLRFGSIDRVEKKKLNKKAKSEREKVVEHWSGDVQAILDAAVFNSTCTCTEGV